MGGFFGPTEEFDRFLALYMSPAMEAGGFKRAKRVYRLQHNGASVVVQARLYTPMPVVSFHVQWAATPAILRDYLRESRPRWRPSMSLDSMIFASLLGASRLCGTHPATDTRFDYADPAIDLPPGYEQLLSETVSIDEFGPRYLEFLQTIAVPKWQRALTLDYLRTANETDNDLGGNRGPHCAGPWNQARFGRSEAVDAILGVDTLPHDKAATAIDQYLPADDPIVPWLRARLARRS